MKLKKGQVGIWTGSKSMPYTAKPYLHCAQFIKYDNEFVTVRWIQPCKQEDGGYYKESFIWTDKILQV